MSKVVDLDDRLDVAVDPDADPADWDEALARFLLAFVRKQSRSSPATALAEAAIESNSNPPT